MSFHDLVQSVVEQTIGSGGALSAFKPELIICATIVAILLARTIAPRWLSLSFYLTTVGLLVASYFAVPWNWFYAPVPAPTEIFSGVLISDSFTVVMRGLLLFFAILFTALTQLAATTSNQDDMTDFYVLMLGSLLGMCLMISANHLLLIILGVEMASVPCYVLAGMKRNCPKSSEAALKYAVFGAAAAGVMLYGLSLLAGVLGSTHLPTMVARLAEMLQQGTSSNATMILVLGGLMLSVGVAFKLSAVPFHFWAPDVFEGATAEVAAFLSVASKAAALGLLVRLAIGFSYSSNHAELTALEPVRHYICILISVVAGVTCTFGNLAAYGQTNIKRLLAYSTIAHAGYMMMPVAAAVALAGINAEAACRAIASLVVYISIYLFMNLAAFAMVAFIRNNIHSEEIADYAGLIRTSPGLTICLAIVMFSLVGLPPLAGFSAKMTIIIAMISANLGTLVMVAVLNTLLSLFYYLRVVKVAVLSPAPLHHEPPRVSLFSMAGSYCTMLTIPVVALFFLLGYLWDWANAAASALFY